MKNAALSGKPYAGNPHVRFEEREVASVKSMRGSLLNKGAVFVGFAVMGAAMALANVNDDAAFIHYGAEFKADGDVYAWPDVRHYSTFNPSSVADTHKTSGGDGKSGKTVAAVADITTPTLGRTLKNEPIVRLNHEVVTNAQGAVSYNCTALGFCGCKAGQKIYSFLLRFRPKMGRDWMANGQGENERLACVSVNWADHRGIYIEVSNRAADGSYGYIRIENNSASHTSSNLKVVNGLWHELAVIVDMNTVTLGLCNETFTSDPDCWKWESVTFADGYDFGLKGPNDGSLSRGTKGETKSTSTRGDFHYLAMWNRALSKGEVYEAFSGGRSASALSFGFDTDAACAEAYSGGSGDATVVLRPWGWSAMPATLANGQKISFTFDVTEGRDRLLQALKVVPTDGSGAGTVDVSLDGETVGSLNLDGGQPDELMLADRLLMGTRTVTLERTDASAATLSLKSLSFGQVARKGNVFNDALLLKYGTLVEDANGYAVGWPDYRHYSTWNPNSRVGTHVTTESAGAPANATRSVTMDVYSPTAGRTLKNESVIRMDHQVITNANGSYTVKQSELAIKGLTSGQKVWSLLVRFRPDLDGWNKGNDWDRLFCMSPTWNADPEQSRGLFIGLNKSGKIGFQNGNVNEWWDSLVVTDKAWHELAIVVSNNTIKAGLCNPNRNTVGDNKSSSGQWVWKKKTYSDKTQFGFANDTGVLGRRQDNATGTTATRGDFHMVAMWNRVLDESEVCEAFASSHTPLVDVGFDEDGVSAEVFAGDSTKDVVLGSSRPWSWHELPYALKTGRQITIPFTKESWHDGLPQVLRIYPDSASADGCKVRVSIDGKSIANLTLVPGKMDCSTYLRASDIALGNHMLTIARTDSGAGDLVLAGVSIEGSWQVGPESGKQLGSYTTSNNSNAVPYWFDVVSGGWASVAGFTRNDWDAAGVGPSRFRFEIPGDMLAAGYRYRLQYKLWTAYRDPVEGHPIMFILNGVTNYLHHTEMTKVDYTAAQAFELDASLLRPGLNVFEFFDNRQIPDPTASDRHYIANAWTTLEYVRVLAKPPKTGLVVVIQ